MKTSRYLPAVVAAVVVAFGLSACGDSPTAILAALYNDSTVTVDVATSAGDAAAMAIETMQLNEASAAVPAADIVSSGAFFSAIPTNSLATTRTRTCFDAAGAIVTGCIPIASVRKIATRVTFDGTRTGSSTTSGGSAATWTGAVHRISNDTLTRVFNTATPAVETARIHNDVGTSRDTTTFTDAIMTRSVVEAATDSVKAVTWTLPRSANPYPISGSIVRVAVIHVSITKGTLSESKDVTRTVQVDFPADAQGNVVLKVNAKICSLNLVTHVVSGCH